MTRNQIQQMVDELAEDLRAHVFQALDAEIWITSGPAAMLHKTAPGLGGGLTNAMPPKGQRTMSSARPPNCRQASAWPNS